MQFYLILIIFLSYLSLTYQSSTPNCTSDQVLNKTDNTCMNDACTFYSPKCLDSRLTWSDVASDLVCMCYKAESTQAIVLQSTDSPHLPGDKVDGCNNYVDYCTYCETTKLNDTDFYLKCIACDYTSSNKYLNDNSTLCASSCSFQAGEDKYGYKTCERCPIKEIWNATNSQCEACPTGEVSDDGLTCKSCSTLGLSDCDECTYDLETSTATCTKCANGIYLSTSNTCTTFCTPKIEYHDTENKVCKPCSDLHPQCQECQSYGQFCSACQDGFFPIELDCVTCDDQTNSRSGIAECLKCSQGTETPICLQCDNSKYYDPNTGTCTDCVSEQEKRTNYLWEWSADTDINGTKVTQDQCRYCGDDILQGCNYCQRVDLNNITEVPTCQACKDDKYYHIIKDECVDDCSQDEEMEVEVTYQTIGKCVPCNQSLQDCSFCDAGKCTLCDLTQNLYIDKNSGECKNCTDINALCNSCGYNKDDDLTCFGCTTGQKVAANGKGCQVSCDTSGKTEYELQCQWVTPDSNCRYNGNKEIEVSNKTEAECKNLCETNEKCNAISYQSSASNCILNMGTDTYYDSESGTSCHQLMHCNKECYWAKECKDCEFIGNKASNSAGGSSLSDCQEQCKLNTTCLGISYATNSCFLHFDNNVETQNKSNHSSYVRKCKAASTYGYSQCVLCANDGPGISGIPNCEQCSISDSNWGNLTCSQCSSGAAPLLHNNTCVSQCPDTHQNKTTPNECKSCSEEFNGCATCNNTECLSCSNSSHYFSSSKEECLAACPNQSYYIKDNTCLECDTVSGKRIIEDLAVCESDCSNVAGYFNDSDKSNFTCLPCSNITDNCATCNKSQCLTCDTSSLLKDKTCGTCPDGEYDDNGICTDCNSECKTCTNNTQCLTCKDGFYTQDSGVTCTSCSTTNTNCLECTDGSTCTSCDNDLNIAINGSCVANCEADLQYEENKKCYVCANGIADCYKCSSKDVCISCKKVLDPPGMYLKNNECIQDCGNNTDNNNLFYKGDENNPNFSNLTCHDVDESTEHPNCQYIEHDNTACKFCDCGYLLVNDTCHDMASLNLTDCKEAMIVDNVPKCVECLQNATNELFLINDTCDDGFDNDGNLVNDYSGISFQDKYKSSAGFLINSSNANLTYQNVCVTPGAQKKWYSCRDRIPEENCAACNSSSYCLQCDSGFYLNHTEDATKCLDCPTGHEGSITCEFDSASNTSVLATSCTEGFFFDAPNHRCFKCGAGCKTCDLDKCLTCYDEEEFVYLGDGKNQKCGKCDQAESEDNFQVQLNLNGSDFESCQSPSSLECNVNACVKKIKYLEEISEQNIVNTEVKYVITNEELNFVEASINNLCRDPTTYFDDSVDIEFKQQALWISGFSKDDIKDYTYSDIKSRLDDQNQQYLLSDDFKQSLPDRGLGYATKQQNGSPFAYGTSIGSGPNGIKHVLQYNKDYYLKYWCSSDYFKKGDGQSVQEPKELQYSSPKQTGKDKVYVVQQIDGFRNATDEKNTLCTLTTKLDYTGDTHRVYNDAGKTCQELEQESAQSGRILENINEIDPYIHKSYVNTDPYEIPAENTQIINQRKVNSNDFRNDLKDALEKDGLALKNLKAVGTHQEQQQNKPYFAQTRYIDSNVNYTNSVFTFRVLTCDSLIYYGVQQDNNVAPKTKDEIVKNTNYKVITAQQNVPVEVVVDGLAQNRQYDLYFISQNLLNETEYSEMHHLEFRTKAVQQFSPNTFGQTQFSAGIILLVLLSFIVILF